MNNQNINFTRVTPMMTLLRKMYLPLVCFTLLMPAVKAEDLKVDLHGFGFVRAGRLQHMTDTLDYNYNGNWMEAASAQIVANVVINDNLDGAMGIGAAQEHKMQGRTLDARAMEMNIVSYVAQARMTYTVGDRAAPPFQLTMGLFPYNYNSDIRNLGLYLMRGTVYPGYLISGFEQRAVMPIANTMGFRINNNWGNFSQDFIMASEIENRPMFDFSLIYVAKAKLAEGLFNVGAGINLYHIIPINPDITSPHDASIFGESKSPGQITGPNDYDYIYAKSDTAVMDTTVTGAPAPVACGDLNFTDCQAAGPNREFNINSDTTWLSHKGIKLVGFFSLSLNKILQIDILGEEDLKIYGEAAVIGVQNVPGVYTDITQRIPIMMGFNIPTFKLLNRLSLEVEWYGARYINDLEGVNVRQSPNPVSNQESARTVVGDTAISLPGSPPYPNIDPYNLENMVKDNWKWSLHGERVFGGHLKISGQIANDHFRPGGTGISPSYATAFSTLDDWYWMMKLSYFF